MAVAVRATDTYVGTATQVIVTGQPSGTQSLDRLLMVIVQPAATHLDSIPTGWSAVDTAFASGTILRVLKYTPGGSAQAAPWVFAFTDDAGAAVSARYAVAVMAVQPGPAVGGVTYRPDIEAYLMGVSASSTGPAVVGPVTPVAANDLLLSVVSWPHGSSFTPPGGTTEVVDTRTGSGLGDLSLFVGSELLTGGAGVATGTRSIANDNPFAAGATSFGLALLAVKSAPPPTSWLGDFSTGDFTQYESVESAPGGVTVVTDTRFRSGKAAELTAHDADVYPVTSTANPRAQLNSRILVALGDEKWFTYSFVLPADFPSVPYFPDGWLAFWQIYGPPFIGSPSIALAANGNNICFQEYGFDFLWSTPTVHDVVHEFAFRIKLGLSNTTGWLEGFYNRGGKTGTPTPMRFINTRRGTELSPSIPGRRRYYFQNMAAENTDGFKIKPTLYRKQGIFDVATMRVGDVSMDVAPPSWLPQAFVGPAERRHG